MGWTPLTQGGKHKAMTQLWGQTGKVWAGKNIDRCVEYFKRLDLLVFLFKKTLRLLDPLSLSHLQDSSS